MKCQNCGCEVNASAKFCRECGAEVLIQTEALNVCICVECGNEVEENAIFCNNCGHRMIDEQSDVDESTKRCPKCGTQLNADAMFCKECGTSLNNNELNAVNDKGHKKKDKGLIFLIILLIIVLIGCSCVVGYIYYQNNTYKIETPNIEEPINETDDKVVEENKKEDVSNADVDVENDDVTEKQNNEFNIEEEVSRIRALYNDTQSNLSNLTKKTMDNGVVKYYDSNSNLVRADIPANSITPYTKYYYFNNGNIYFAFVFDGEKENRLYFNNDVLFRWIDEAGKTHDNETNNGTFKFWENEVVDDVRTQL